MRASLQKAAVPLSWRRQAYPGADDSVLGFPVVRYPSIDMTKLVGYHAGFPFSEKTVKTLMEYPIDLIHCHCPVTSAVLARELRSRIHVPTVFTYHTKFDIDIANAIHAKILQEGAKKILVENINAFDEVWTVSHGAGENLRSLGYEGDWRVMPNGVDFAKGRVEEETVQEVCKDFDLPAGVPVFLFVGRMMWYKGLRITLDALKLLKDAGHAFRMVFVGNGGDKDEVVAYSKELRAGRLRIFYLAEVRPDGHPGVVLPRGSVFVPVDVRYERPCRARSGGLRAGERACARQLRRGGHH